MWVSNIRDEEIEVGSHYFLFVIYLVDVHAITSVNFDTLAMT